VRADHPVPGHAGIITVPRTILHLIDTGGPGGAETIFAELVTRLGPAEWRSVPVVPKDDWLASTLRERGSDPMVLPSRRSFDLSYLRALRSIVTRHDVDLVQTHLLSTSVYGTLATWFRGIPVVSTFHGVPDIPAGGLLIPVKRAILRERRNHVVFVSRSLRDRLGWGSRSRGHPPQVIPNGIDCGVFRMEGSSALRRELGLGGDALLLGALGNLRPSKRYDVLLEAFALVRDRVSSAHLAIAGQPKDPLFQELLQRRLALGLEDSVHFLGFRSDVPEFLRGLDLFVLSSGDEGFSLATVQAMATGLPIVATRCGGPEEIVEHGAHGVLVEVEDPPSLARGILDVLSMPDRGKGMGRAARERAVDRFSVEAMIRQYEALYRRSLGLPEKGRVGCAGS